MKRFAIIFVLLLFCFSLNGCTTTTGEKETGILSVNSKEVYIGQGTAVKNILDNHKITHAMKYQNDLILSHYDVTSSFTSISRFSRGVRSWTFGNRYQLSIVETLDHSLIVKYPTTDDNSYTYSEINLTTGNETILLENVFNTYVINNHHILETYDTKTEVSALHLLIDNQVSDITSSDKFLTVRLINDTTFYTVETLENNEFNVTVFDIEGNKYGSKIFEDINNLVQYDTYFYYLDFLSLSIYDFDFNNITNYEFEYRIGTTITIEGFEEDGLILDVDRFVSKSLRKIMYNGDAIIDYRGRDFKAKSNYASYDIIDLYRFDNEDVVSLNYHPNQNPSGILKRTTKDNEVLWSIEIEDEFIRHYVFEDYVRILTTSVIKDYDFNGKLIKIINTKCDYPDDLFEGSYTCQFDRLYVYDYNNDQVFEKKYLTDAEYFHSSYDYYIVSDYRLNESINLRYHYYNFYQNDGDEMFRSNTPFVDQFNLDTKTYVLVATISEENIILEEYRLLEYDETGEIVNEFTAYQTSTGVIYVDGPALVIIDK